MWFDLAFFVKFGWEIVLINGLCFLDFTSFLFLGLRECEDEDEDERERERGEDDDRDDERDDEQEFDILRFVLLCRFLFNFLVGLELVFV